MAEHDDQKFYGKKMYVTFGDTDVIDKLLIWAAKMQI